MDQAKEHKSKQSFPSLSMSAIFELPGLRTCEQKGAPCRWFHRACARPDGHDVRSLHVRGNALFIEAAIRELKAQLVGEIEVAGPDLAGSLTNLGLIDEYRLYLHPVVLGRGKPFFSGPRPPLRLVASDLIAEDVIRLTYVPA
jgi:riboflavin biosynthesis pyrimidine reductase